MTSGFIGCAEINRKLCGLGDLCGYVICKTALTFEISWIRSKGANEKMATDAREMWREMFLKWPASIPKRGVLVSTLNEATPFKSFLLKGETLMLERTNPDPLGARFIFMGFEAIHMVKLIDPLREEVFTSAGFTGHFAK